MGFSMTALLAFGPFIGAALFCVLVLALLVRASGMIRYIGNNRVAVVEKLWSASGSIPGGLIALKGEAGYQPEVLRGGVHFFMPFQFRLHVQSLVTIPQGRIRWGPTSRTPAPSLKAAVRRVPNARCSARAPMPSTSPSSWW